jgi:signal transduction histidine kinase
MGTEIQTEADELRRQISDLLAGDDFDFEEFIRLSNELAKQDPDQVRFSADAALISRLGQELVSKQETAVSELIKNAYDADARIADLIFYDADEPGGRLEIIDDGNGMTRQQIIDGFMRISSTDKVENPISPRFDRSRAGKKGIGRFAAQRLGRELEIRTRHRESGEAHRVIIDWSQFQGGRDLTTIGSRIEEYPEKTDDGTTLIIRDLREAWTEATIKRLFRYTSEITQPFPLSEQREDDSEDPGFKTRLFREESGDLDLIADEETEILEHSLAKIRGRIDNDGIAKWSLISERLGIEEENLEMGREEDGGAFQELRDVSFAIHYFIYKRDLIEHGYLTTIRDLASKKGGVRVYRNGFRVLPYGEEWDDWLRLDEVYRKRQVLPPISTDHVFGFVEIEDPRGKQFEETSSREGLIENTAYREMRSCLHRIIVDAVQKVARYRGRKETAAQGNWDESEEATSQLRSAADEMAETASRTKEEANERDPDDERRREREERFEEAQSRLEQAIEEVVEEIDMLRILASLGLSIGEFTHEIKNTIGGVVSDAGFLAHVLDQSSRKGERASRLYESVKSFKSYSAYFDQAVARNVSRETEIQPLHQIARRFYRTTREGADNFGIDLREPEVNGVDPYACEMHPSEWPAILFNLYTNAKKAIDRADVQRGKILIRVGRKGDQVYLEFQDNGIGIPEENEDRIFDPFFTTMPPAGVDAPEEEALQGSGLGLKIVKDMVSSYRGDIFVTEPDPGYSTCIRIELPAATDEEIQEYND